MLTTGGEQAGPVAARLVSQALAAPPGPVIALMDDSAPAGLTGPAGQAPWPADDLSPLATALRTARRPVLILGARAIAHTAAIRRAVAGRGLPVLHTYRARGIVPDSGPEAAGLVTGGTMEWPLLAHADLIIGLGVDEAEMIPAAWDYAAPTMLVSEWPGAAPGPRATSAAPATLTAPLPGAIGLLADGHRPAAMLGRPRPGAPPGPTPRSGCPGRPGRRAPPPARPARPATGRRAGPGAHPGGHDRHRRRGRAHAGGDAAVGSGPAAPAADLQRTGHDGLALPAAVAAALATPDQPVVAFTGDGGLGMTLAEIETAVRLRLRIVVVVFNDATLSLIKIKQRPAGHGGGEAVATARSLSPGPPTPWVPRPWSSAPRRSWPRRWRRRCAGTAPR